MLQCIMLHYKIANIHFRFHKTTENRNLINNETERVKIDPNNNIRQLKKDLFFFFENYLR